MSDDEEKGDGLVETIGGERGSFSSKKTRSR